MLTVKEYRELHLNRDYRQHQEIVQKNIQKTSDDLEVKQYYYPEYRYSNSEQKIFTF